jgi:hypothetical protein
LKQAMRMRSGERPISVLIADSLDEVREILRAEVKLAKAELLAKLPGVASAGVLVGIGMVGALLSAVLIICACVLALCLVMPAWLATLVSAASLAILSGVALTIGLNRFRRISPVPARTVASLKENVEWARQLTK